MNNEELYKFIESVASDSPTPGGGAAVAYATSLAIALARMSINVSVKRKSYQNNPQEEKDKVNKVLEWLERLQKEAFDYKDKDEEAFKNYMSVYKSTDEKKKEEASFLCYNVPYLLLELCIRAVNLIFVLKPYIVKSIISDYKLALEILKSSLNGCLMNMDINLDGIHDEGIKDDCANAHRSVKSLIEQIDKVLGE